tara:strand:+ start:9204 stop:9470 length:267 start_codon:yes stop_codon:yes gene_type:complete
MADNKNAFDFPSNNQLVEADLTITPSWLQWVSRIHSIVITGQQSGPTASRPTTQLWIGRQWYDETLNKPIYVRAVKPTVWRDAAGTIV